MASSRFCCCTLNSRFTKHFNLYDHQQLNQRPFISQGMPPPPPPALPPAPQPSSPQTTDLSAEWDFHRLSINSHLYPVTLNGIRCNLQSDDCQLSFSNTSSRNRHLTEVRRYWWREISHIELCAKNRRLLYLHLLYAVVVLPQNPLYPVTVVKFGSARARNAFVKECTDRLGVLRLVEEEEEEEKSDQDESVLDENGNVRARGTTTTSSTAKTRPFTIPSLCHLFCLCLKRTPACNPIYEPVLSKVYFP